MRRSTQVLMHWAAKKIHRAVDRHRARLAARAATRPLLLRPDSTILSLWKYLVLIAGAFDVYCVLSFGEDRLHPTPYDWVKMADGQSCTRHYVDGPRRWHLGPRTTAALPLPEHCTQQGFATIVVFSLLAGAIGSVAVVDTVVEYFTGVVDPVTGVLKPKDRLTRVFYPPGSLLFNVAANPAMSSVYAMILSVLFAEDTFSPLRIVVWLQPLCQHVEAWVTPWARTVMHDYAAEYFRSSRSESGGERTTLESTKAGASARSATARGSINRLRAAAMLADVPSAKAPRRR